MLKGILFLLLAEFCFASATLFAKFVTNNSQIPAIEVTFFRFFLGFIFSYWYMLKYKQKFAPQNKTLVIWRALLNTISVFLFFIAVQYSTLTNANMLNMTYPVFIFLFAPFMVNEKNGLPQTILLIITMLGISMVINPQFGTINFGDVIGLLSGITGALAILTLRKAREFDSTALILFYLMGIGSVINGLLLIPYWVKPSNIHLLYMVISGLLGYLGQFFITSGYKYIETNKGSLVSASRIPFAVLLGVVVLSETISFNEIIGGILILSALIGVAWLQINKR